MMASNGIDCYVKLPSGKTLSFLLEHSDSVGKVYSKVAEELNVSTDRVLIKYTGKILNRSHTVGYLGVCKETILKAEVIQVKMLHVYVKLECGKTVPVTIENTSPVRNIKDHIHTQEGIDPDRQCLKVSGREITNCNQKCMDTGITDETVLNLTIKAIKVIEPAAKGAQKGAADNAVVIDEAEKEAVLGSFDAAGRPVEVVFSFDTTGSMYSCLVQVRDKLKTTVSRLIQQIPNIRIGIIAHGDYCDDQSTYVICQCDLNNDVEALVSFVETVQATGGGDAPEAYEWVLRKAQQLDWSEDSAKALVIIGDDVPHVVSFTDQQLNWHDELDVLKGLGVKVYGVRADHGSGAAPFYQELADRTGGAYITFSNFSIIADMFLAVCYHEASEDQFANFCQEVDAEAEQGSKVAENVKEVLKQIEDSAKTPAEDKPRKYLDVAWWDPEKDNGRPQYRYNVEKDKWAPFRETVNSNSLGATSAPVVSSSSFRSRFSFRRKSARNSPAHTTSRGKKGCVLM